MKAVVIFSGGMDSATLIHYYMKEGYQVLPIGINYGQRHNRELDYARKMCEHVGLDYQVIDLTAMAQFMKGSALTDDVEVPEGHYAEESMKATVVPNRNMLMLAAAGSYAISVKADVLAFGAHAGDHTIYPDCRPEFAEALNFAFRKADWHRVRLEAPFIRMTKTEICGLGHELDVPFEKTWSCYKGNPIHCGRCGTCVERQEAFQLAGVRDPTEYDS